MFIFVERYYNMNHLAQIIKVKKNSGEIVPFDVFKFQKALLRSGVKQENIEDLTEEILYQIYDGISTKKIYQIAYKILRKKSKHLAGRYRLKKSIFELGPSGYPFEKFISRLLFYQGYKVQTGVFVKGACVEHEVDVVAEKDDEIMMVECKFHSTQGRTSDVKVSLYIHARFQDIKSTFQKKGLHKNKKFTAVLATNTRFTDDAIRFGRCANLQMISWNYPLQNNLLQWIEQSGYQPITCLTSVTKKVKQQLMENDIVLCRELEDNISKMRSIGLREPQIKAILKEVKNIFN